MRMNKNNQCVLSEDDVVRAWLEDKTITSGIFEDTVSVEAFNSWCFAQDIDAIIQTEKEYTGDDYVEQCTTTWHMPDEYKQLDIVSYLINLTTTDTQRDRVMLETDEFKQRGLLDVLRFLKYMVDLCKDNNVVLGVGRGSSVASYCLFLLGVHKIDSLKYKLDIGEFLK